MSFNRFNHHGVLGGGCGGVFIEEEEEIKFCLQT